MVYHSGCVVRASGDTVGVDDGEGPPVPIPNTEVKLAGAENTWLATAREDRKTPTQKAAIFGLRLFAYPADLPM